MTHQQTPPAHRPSLSPHGIAADPAQIEAAGFDPCDVGPKEAARAVAMLGPHWQVSRLRMRDIPALLEFAGDTPVWSAAPRNFKAMYAAGFAEVTAAPSHTGLRLSDSDAPYALRLATTEERAAGQMLARPAPVRLNTATPLWDAMQEIPLQERKHLRLSLPETHDFHAGVRERLRTIEQLLRTPELPGLQRRDVSALIACAWPVTIKHAARPLQLHPTLRAHVTPPTVGADEQADVDHGWRALISLWGEITASKEQRFTAAQRAKFL